MNNDLIQYLRPFSLAVVERYGKLKSNDFLSKLEEIFIEQSQNDTWFNLNRTQISIATSLLITNALTDWLEVQYQNYPHPTERNDLEVISGKVETVTEASASSMYSFSEQNGWGLWHASGMTGGKKLQTIYLHDEDAPYYVIWGKDSIGIRQYNIIDFKWEQKGAYRVIVKKTIEGHGDGFSGSKPITVNKIHYPSIHSAYSRIKPSVTYSTVCTRLRKNKSPEDAFNNPNMRINSDLNKLGIAIKKEPWIKSHRKIS